VVRPDTGAHHRDSNQSKEPMTTTASKSHRRARARSRWAGFTFVLPALVLFVIFFVSPLVLTVWISLNNWPLLGAHSWVGFANFGEVLGDPQFWRATGFTLEFALLVVPILFVVGLVLALLLSASNVATAVIRTVIFLPVSLGFAAASYLWLSLLDPNVGTANQLLADVGIIPHRIDWFDTGLKALLVVVAITVWKFAGFSMVGFINGLNSIPKELEEAASIDGAGPIRVFFSIKLPLLRQTTAFVLTFLIVTAFLTFDQFYILTAGGPQNSTITVVYWIYNTSFIRENLGTGSAMSLIFLVMLAAVTGLQLFLLRQRKEGTN
jgi:multiple sugar transport system permease protein